jgi:hypothetical protein
MSFTTPARLRQQASPFRPQRQTEGVMTMTGTAVRPGGIWRYVMRASAEVEQAAISLLSGLAHGARDHYARQR